MATTPMLFICNQGAGCFDNLDFEWSGPWKLPLAQPSRTFFYRLRGITHRAKIHLSEFRHLGRVGFVCPLGILGLDFDHVWERSRTKELLPSTENILKPPLREIGHFRSQSLEALIGFAERSACRLQSCLEPLLNLLTHSVSLIGHPLGF